MADTNNERVGKALDLLKEGLAPFVAREVKAALSDKQLNAADLQRFTSDPMLSKRPVGEWDVAGLLALMWETWNQVFRQTLGPAERGLVGELRGQSHQMGSPGALLHRRRLPGPRFDSSAFVVGVFTPSWRR